MTKLRDLRLRLALTQEDLAKTAGIHATAISRIENGHHRPRPATLRRIAQALGVDVTFVYDSIVQTDESGEAAQ